MKLMKRLAASRSPSLKKRDMVEEERLEPARQRDVVAGAQRAPAQRVEIEPRDAADRLRHRDDAPEPRQASPASPRAAPVRRRNAASIAASAAASAGQ